MSTMLHQHPQPCRCSLHGQTEARRHECYRQLARAILGPAAPREDAALARALADHTSRLQATSNITPFRRRPAA
jgi:hypothetical protein